MNRIASLVLTLIAITGIVAGTPVNDFSASSEDPTHPVAIDQHTVNQTANVSDLPPGERLAGVIGFQEAEFTGEVETRTFEIKVNKASTPNATAGVIHAELDSIADRLEVLEARKQALDAARANGSISEGQYRAQMAKLAAQTATLHRLADASSTHANGLPESVLRANDINVTAIEELKQNASELTGPEVAAMAKTIARPDSSVGSMHGPPGPTGASANTEATAAIRRAAHHVTAAKQQVEHARQRVNNTNASTEAITALEEAKTELATAQAALTNARTALDAGNDGDAIALAGKAIEHATAAEEHAEDALHQAQGANSTAGEDEDGGQSGNDDNPGGTHGERSGE